MKEYRNNSNSTEKYNSGRYGGIYFDVEAFVNATNTALTQAMINFKQVSVTINMSRRFAGKPTFNHVIYSGDLLALIYASSLRDSSYDFLSPTVTGDSGYTIFVQEAVGVNAVGYKGFTVPFGGAIDCDLGDTEISVSIVCGSSFFSTALNNASSSMIVGLIPTESAEGFLPKIYQEYLDAGSTIYQKNLEGFVTEAVFCNYDQASNLNADQVISTCNISDTNGNDSIVNSRLLGERMKMFEDAGDAEDRCQSFVLIPFRNDKLRTNVGVNLTLDGSNVNAGNNVFVAWCGIPSSASLVATQNVVSQQEIQIKQLASSIID